MLMLTDETINKLAKNWGLFILRGIIAIIFGILVVAWPIGSIFTLVIFFGVFALVDGIFLIIFGAIHKSSWGNRAWLIFSGVVGIAAGVVTFAWPALTAVGLLIVIAFWAVITGIAEVVYAFVLHTNAANKVLLALGGVFSIIFGIFLFVRPALGALAVVWLIGLFAVMAGMYHIGFGINLKALEHKTAAKTDTPVKS